MNIPHLSSKRFKNTRTPYRVMTIVFQIIHVVFALNFGFLKPKSCYSKIALNLFSFIKCLVITVSSISEVYSNEETAKFVWFCLSLLIYLISVSILSYPTDRTLCNLFLELQEIDSKLKVDDSQYNLEYKIVLSIFVCIMHKTILTLCHCIYTGKCLKPLWVSLIFFCITLCLEISHVCFTFIFISANCRLKQLTIVLRKTESNFTSIQYIYKSLVDITEKYKSAYDPVYSVALILTMPALLISWSFALQSISQANVLDLCARFAVLLETFILTTFPALVADTLTAQVDQIKVLLHEKHLESRDEDHIKNIVRFIQYVDARGCRFRVCGFIPLNANLLGMVLSFCVTYLIVILQFSRDN